MAVKKISEFTELLNIQDDDVLLIERDGAGYSVKASVLKQYFSTGGGGIPEDPDTFTVEITETQSVNGQNVPAKIATGMSDFIETNAEWTNAGEDMYNTSNLSAVVKNGDGTEYLCSGFYKSALYGLFQSGDDNGKFTFQITYDTALVPEGAPAEIKQKDFCYFMASDIQFTLPVTITISKVAADTNSITGQLTETFSGSYPSGTLTGFYDFLEANGIKGEEENGGIIPVSGISCEAEGANGVKLTFNQFIYAISGPAYVMAYDNEEAVIAMNIFGAHSGDIPEDAGKDFAYLSEANGMTLPITVTLTKSAVAPSNDTFTMTLTTGGASYEQFEGCICWQGDGLEDWLNANAVAHDDGENICYDGISLTIKDSGNIDETFNSLASSSEQVMSSPAVCIFDSDVGKYGHIGHATKGPAVSMYLKGLNMGSVSFSDEVVFDGSDPSSFVPPVTITLTKNA